MKQQDKSFWEMTNDHSEDPLTVLTQKEAMTYTKKDITNIAAELYGEWDEDSEDRASLMTFRKGDPAEFELAKANLLPLTTSPSRRKMAYIVVDKNITKDKKGRLIKDGRLLDSDEKPRGFYQIACPSCGTQYSPASGSELQSLKCTPCTEKIHGTKKRLTEVEKKENELNRAKRRIEELDEETLTHGMLQQVTAVDRLQRQKTNWLKKVAKIEKQLEEMRA